MTRIVVSLTADSPDGMIASARAAPDADYYECRLDHLARVDADALRALADALPGKALATYRPEREGGRFRGPDSAREPVLAAALAHGFAAVDVEHDAAFADRLLARARAAGALGVLSRHDLAGTPDAESIVKFAEEAAARGADVAKFATHVRDAQDAHALVEAATRSRQRGLGVALMGVNDAMLRLLAPALGLALAYAAPDAGAAAAPGQLPAALVADAHRALGPSTARASTRLVLLLGHPVAHSASPAFQNAAFRAAGVDATYAAADVPPERLADAVRSLRALGCLGANVTVPHKVAALQHLDALDASARAAGAVNTIVNDAGRLVGHNTDGAGALAALREAGVDVARERALIVGAGGAARGVARALKDAGATIAGVANRTRENAQDLARRVGAPVVAWDARADAVADATLLVNCTSLGLHERDAPVVVDRALRVNLAILDAAYTAGETPLVRAARRAGCRAVVSGDAMLLHQGARAFELWTGRTAPVGEMRAALREAMRK